MPINAEYFNNLRECAYTNIGTIVAKYAKLCLTTCAQLSKRTFTTKPNEQISDKFNYLQPKRDEQLYYRHYYRH